MPKKFLWAHTEANSFSFPHCSVSDINASEAHAHTHPEKLVGDVRGCSGTGRRDQKNPSLKANVSICYTKRCSHFRHCSVSAVLLFPLKILNFPELIPALTRAEQRAATSLKWRTHEKLLQKYACLPHVISSDQIYYRFLHRMLTIIMTNVSSLGSLSRLLSFFIL